MILQGQISEIYITRQRDLKCSNATSFQLWIIALEVPKILERRLFIDLYMLRSTVHFQPEFKWFSSPEMNWKYDTDLRSILKPGGIVLMLAKIFKKDQYLLQSNF